MQEKIVTITDLSARLGRHKSGVLRYVRDLEKRTQQTFLHEGRKGGRPCFVVTAAGAKKILENRKRDGFTDGGEPQLRGKGVA